MSGMVLNTKGSELEGKDVITAAFLCYLDIRTNRPLNGVETFLEERASIVKEEGGFWNAAFWLWTLGEYANAGGSEDVLFPYADTVANAIEIIGREWSKPRPHWLVPGPRGIYLSNLAIANGGLLAVNNRLRDETAQSLMKEIREYVFGKLMNRGIVASALGSRELLGDIGVSAVPFGLLNAGDQVLAGAVNLVEERLVTEGVRFSVDDTYYGGCIRPDLTALLAWYYSERGEIARAKWLIQRVRQQWEKGGTLLTIVPESAKEPDFYLHDTEEYGPPPVSELAGILHDIAQANIARKETGHQAEERAVVAVHRPSGSGSPYLTELVERFPRYPEHEEAVTVQMKTDPFRASTRATIQVAADGGDWEAAPSEPMELCVSNEGEKYWRAELGRFAFGTQVRYRFLIEDLQEVSVSEAYEFKVRKWKPLTRVVQVYSDQESLELRFEPIEGMAKGHCPIIKLTAKDDRSVALSFEVHNGASEPAAGVLTEDTSEAALSLGRYRLSVDTRSGTLRAVDGAGRLLLQTYGKPGESPFELWTDGSGNLYKLRAKLRLQSDERLYGTGERYSELEFRGRDIDHYVFNQYKDQGLKTYMPVPLAISSGGYGLFLNTSLYSIFRFGTRAGDLFEAEMDLLAEHPRAGLHLFLGTPAEVIEAYTDVTGKPKLPPKWAFGPWMSSNNWDSQAETYRQLEATAKHRIPATVFVLEQWSDEATFYIFNDSQYEPKTGMDFHCYGDFRFPEWGRWPDPKKMVEDIHAQGMRLLLWQIPVIKFMEGISHLQKDEDERTALAHGLCVKRRGGEAYRIPSWEWFKDSLVPDFSNPLTREWWFNKRKYLMDELGVDGFKTDGGECIYGEDTTFFDGRTGPEMRNLYPNEYIGAYYDFAQKHSGGDAITFSRSGYAGAQNYPMHWAGDERSTYEAFRSSIVAGLTSGLSGIPFWGWDLGGFNGDIPTAELYIRSAQMAAFCPIMQYHAETKGQYNQDRTPWNIAERTGKPWVLTAYKKFADLRMNLLPYIYDQAIKTSCTGIPMMRAMVVAYPHEPACIGLKMQYMFGDALLVAPVAEEGRTTKDVYLPEGKWLSLFSSEVLEGGRLVRVAADIDEIPVYQKQDSVVAWNFPQDYRMAGDIGNRVDGYTNLTFCMFIVERVEESFQDDLGNLVRCKAERASGSIRVSMSGSVKVPLTIILRNTSCTRVTAGGRTLARAATLDGFAPGLFCLHENDVYLKTDLQSEYWVVQLSE